MLSGGELSVAYVRSLRERGARDRTGRFVVEGVRFLVSAVDAGAVVEGLVIAPGLFDSVVGSMLVRRLKAAGVPSLQVSAAQFLELSLETEPQGVAAVVRQRWTVLAAHDRRDALWVAVDSVRSPGNLGTLMRTCDAVGARGLIRTSPSVDPYHPTAVRASMGALFTQRLVDADLPSLQTWNRFGELLIVGAAPDGERDFRGITYRRPVLLMLGSERRGLSEAQRAACDVLVRIPMTGTADSLNLAVAASVLLYEIYGQRHPVKRAR